MADVANVGFEAEKSKTPNTGGIRGIDKDDFLKLLLVQLRYQDHESTADFKDLLAQMNQLAQIEQLMNMKQAIENLAQTLTRMIFSNSLDLIDRTAWIKGDKIEVKDGVPSAQIGFRADIPFRDVRVLIRDAGGVLVREIKVGNVDAGLHKVQWDGKDARGRKVLDGPYTFEVVAKDASGNDVTLQTFVVGKVRSVFTQGVEVKVDVGGFEGNFNDVVKVEM